MSIFAARPRPRMTQFTGPMAIPLAPHRRPPLGSRVANAVHDALARTQIEAVRRVVLWMLLSLAIGALALAYLYQTSVVASLGSERAAIERETTALRDANARLAGQAAALQTLSRVDAAARDQGFRPALPGSVQYVTITDVPTPSVASTPPTAAAPGLRQRIVDAVTGRASADHRLATATSQASTGVRP